MSITAAVPPRKPPYHTNPPRANRLPGSRVSATYQFVPHLSHRKFVYEFPNPFRERNWGVRGEGTHDPDRIEWLIVDTQTTGTEDRELIESLVGSPSWTIVFGADELVVARRTAPG